MQLHELREALGRAVDELGTEAVIADEKLYEAKEREIAELQGKIDRASKAQSRAAALARPLGGQAGDGASEPIIVRPRCRSIRLRRNGAGAAGKATITCGPCAR